MQDAEYHFTAVFAAEELNYRSETYISIFAQGDKLSTYSAYFTWHCASIPYVKNLRGDGGVFWAPQHHLLHHVSQIRGTFITAQYTACNFCFYTTTDSRLSQVSPFPVLYSNYASRVPRLPILGTRSTPISGVLLQLRFPQTPNPYKYNF